MLVVKVAEVRHPIKIISNWKKRQKKNPLMAQETCWHLSGPFWCCWMALWRGLYTPPHTLAESGGLWWTLVDSKIQKMMVWHNVTFYFISGGVWQNPGGLNSESCRLCWPQYIYTCLTPKPNPNPNPRWWFSCLSLVDSGIWSGPKEVLLQLWAGILLSW